MRQQFQKTFDQIHMSRDQTDRVREALGKLGGEADAA